ncbi:MAG: glycosyltransferase family 1 protein [Prevotella sp.]|nr:glycosyltransferase family 1 protein [Prevotella sp.]
MGKRIVLITLVTPASENIRGTSALPYHLIKGVGNVNAGQNGNSLAGVGADNPLELQTHIFEIYSFNSNKLSDEKIAEVEKELGAKIEIIRLPKWYMWMFKFHLLFFRLFLKYPFVNYIKLPHHLVKEISLRNPDYIWVMGEELSRVVKQFPKSRRIQIGPDTESLYYYRMLGQRFVLKDTFNYWKCALMYRKYARMEKNFCTDDSFTYYAVGEEDVTHLKVINPHINARFLRHPHYEINDKANGNIKFHKPKIKLLIAGQYNLYMKQDGDLLVEQINDNANVNDNYLKEHYSITFLGKGWEKHVETLRGAGYEVEHIRFAPDYIEEICKYDIQITPISIGTGTKGKVLDALANGLLVIGTKYAMENIAVKNGESCIEYDDAKEVIGILKDIPYDIQKYEKIAEEGRRCVLEYHNREKIARELFG